MRPLNLCERGPRHERRAVVPTDGHQRALLHHPACWPDFFDLSVSNTWMQVSPQSFEATSIKQT
ncbi:hypothetical protein EYF80_016972 [Liparis tanakae]|uniref:Uncharacterized protein n=1 Tax=Liparis tanakae TaxID=230148 RepID=A0A4Z2I511_9TELE|nr:hypothetical protein EYF80_016972 [Liparis tanakae]